MPSDLIEPLSDKPSSRSGEPPAPRVEPFAEGTPPPAIPEGVGSTSGDELSAFLAQPRPDPLLGEFSAEGERPRRKGGMASSSADLLKALRLDTDRAPGVGDAPANRSNELDSSSGETSWRTVLLASYASAVTLALIWILWTDRRLPRPEAAEEPAPVEAPASGDTGVRASRSRFLKPGEAPATPQTSLGKTIRLGSIEVRPKHAEWSGVILERTLTSHSLQSGGKNAIKLTLGIKNVSDNAVFAPLDEAFLRPSKTGEVDSYIQPESGKLLGLFDLAVESEWNIVDQVFAELGPGEEVETAVFSVPDVPRPLSGPLTWHLRLRTNVGTTADLAIVVRPDEIKGHDARR